MEGLCYGENMKDNSLRVKSNNDNYNKTDVNFANKRSIMEESEDSDFLDDINNANSFILNDESSIEDYSREYIICHDQADVVSSGVFENSENKSNPIPIKGSNNKEIENERNKLSYSMIIDQDHEEKRSYAEKKYNDIYAVSPRQTLQWISDDKVVKCYKCKASFTFFRRRHHCLVEGTPITLGNGMSRKIENIVKGEKISVWDKKTGDIKTNEGETRMLINQGYKKCMKLVLEDGREIVCTSDHKILCSRRGETPMYVKMCDLNKYHRLICSTSSQVLDEPLLEENDYIIYGTDLSILKDRDKVLALARLCGYWLTSGYIKNNIIFKINDKKDAISICEDIKIISNTKINKIDRYMFECSSDLIKNWFVDLGIMECDKVIRIPHFMLDYRCPKCIQREFIGGWFGGGCGEFIIDSKNNIKFISRLEGVKILSGHMDIIKKIIKSFGIKSETIVSCNSKDNSKSDVECTIDLKNISVFNKYIGIRHSKTQQERMTVCSAYENYRNINIKQKIMLFKEFINHIEFEWDRSSGNMKEYFLLNILSLPIICNEGKEIQVYDLNVPGYKSFIANGIVVHNCRVCGRIFCYECSSGRHYIPENVAVSKNTSQLLQLSDTYLSRDYIRVCDFCNEKIKRLDKLDKHIKVFENIDLEIDDYKMMVTEYDKWINKLLSLRSSKSCNDVFIKYELTFDNIQNNDNIKLWGQISKFFLSAFRGIQYYLPNHEFGTVDKKLLWNNRHHIYNHSKYATQLIRCYIEDTEKLHIILDLYDGKQGNKSCWDLMCSRNCKGLLHYEDLLTIWRLDLSDNRLRQFLVSIFINIDDTSFLAYMQIIVQAVRYDTIDEPIIQNFILSITKNKDNLSNHLYWTLKMACLNRKHGLSYNNFLATFIKCLSGDLFDRIIQGENLVTILQSVPKDLVNENDVKNYIKIKSISQRIRNPIDIDCACNIDIDNFVIKSTITKPIILSFIPDTNSKKVNIKRLLYKAEDIRKDLSIMNLIRLVHKIIDEELNIKTHIVTYDIIPTSHNTGIIEMVDDCETISNIREKKQLTILNYIMNYNKDSSVDIIRNDFMHSCAVYCIVTYLLGIGDRHLDNILVTKRGQLFHVDYSYILGSDPKPFTKPGMRISPEMIDALGGANSKQFLEFEDICTQIYNCLRRHINLFINVMTFLSDMDPPVSPNGISLNNENIINEILNRFVPGEGYQQAKLQFHNVIGTSSARYNQYHNAFIDFFHHHQQEQTLQHVINKTFTGTTGYVNYLYDLVTNYFQDSDEQATSGHN